MDSERFASALLFVGMLLALGFCAWSIVFAITGKFVWDTFQIAALLGIAYRLCFVYTGE